MGFADTLKEEMKTRNFSIYGQWTGILCIFLTFALGVANFFNIFRPLIILFAVFCLVSTFVIIFMEIPLLLRICPTSPKFDAFIRKFETNYMRAALYLAMSLIQWFSLFTGRPTSLIAAAVFLLIAAIFYALAGVKGQAFQGSKALGGAGVAQMII
ncbi:hypothetical protein DM02DRAFT_585398 [Periconia macrospinosa]|uniref:Golgi apparatus membrane protein TVP18 n=1 Tax=Periconia macrospinosa TaxID=97972 RepID=A0A2V1E302_9PLEO|nr:hypothetical protein DM02DRAFT_585398 [Periconia macrospinosa]